MEPLYLDTISSKSRGRVTIDFNKGIRIYLKMNRTTVPSKIPVIIIAVSDGMQYAGGVNALELFQESIKFKQPSSVAREHTKLTSSFGHDGALITYKLRMTVEKVPIATKEKTAPVVNNRAADILRKNEQYRKIYRDLSAQVTFLTEKVDQIKLNQKNQTQVKFQRKAVETQPQQFERYRTKASFENRSRPPLEFQFDDEPQKKRKNRNSDSEFGIGVSDSGINDYASNKFSSQASFEVISASDSKDRKRKKKQNSSSESFDEYPVDESFSGIDDADVENSNGSIEDIADVDDDVVDDADAEKDSNSNKSSDVVEDVVEDLDSDDDKKAKKKDSNKKSQKKESSSNSFESVGSFNSESDHKSSSNKKSAKTSSGSSNSKKILSENSDSRKSSSGTSVSKNLLSETSGSKKLSSNSKSKKLSSDSKSIKKSSGSTALSDFKSDESSSKKSPEFESFSDADKSSDDEKEKSDKKEASSPSDPFASDGSF